MKDYQIIKKKELSQLKGFKRVDFRDLYDFYQIENLPTGAGGCHDMAIINKKREQYMTYCSESPFGKEVNSLISSQKML